MIKLPNNERPIRREGNLNNSTCKDSPLRDRLPKTCLRAHSPDGSIQAAECVICNDKIARIYVWPIKPRWSNSEPKTVHSREQSSRITSTGFDSKYRVGLAIGDIDRAVRMQEDIIWAHKRKTGRRVGVFNIKLITPSRRKHSSRPTRLIDCKKSICIYESQTIRIGDIRVECVDGKVIQQVGNWRTKLDLKIKRFDYRISICIFDPNCNGCRTKPTSLRRNINTAIFPATAKHNIRFRHNRRFS